MPTCVIVPKTMPIIGRKDEVAVQLYEAFNAHNVAQYGIGNYLLGNATFWFSLLLVYIITGSLRVIEKAVHQIWYPNDVEILAENEKIQARHGGPLSGKTGRNLELQGRTTDGSHGGENGDVSHIGGNGDAHATDVPRSQNSSDGRWLEE